MTDSNKPNEPPAPRAIREALERRRAAEAAAEQAQAQAQAQAELEPAAAEDPRRNVVVELQAAADREAARLQVFFVHASCFALLGLAVLLWLTLLTPWPALGGLLVSGVLFFWGVLGFRPSTPVLAHVIIALDANKLDRLLALRPAATGNRLSPPPPAAQDPSTPSPPTKGEP